MARSRTSRLARSRRPRKNSWAHLPDEQVLHLRFKDLGLSLQDTWLESCLMGLNVELHKRGLNVQAHGWISDEWFSPDNTPGIAFPFYLAHPRLMRLERKMFLDVEGGTRRECMKILRHEAGHIIQHAFSLHRRKKWQELFGKSSTPYPESYRPNPKSRNYVQHLRRWYAQSHPDEDFAETFAVWLTPRSDWRTRYAEWPALKKLEYVDDLMNQIAGMKPTLTRRVDVDPVTRSTMTIAEHYRRKLEHYAIEAHTFYDDDLRRIFAKGSAVREAPTAASFLTKNKNAIRQTVIRRTGEYQVVLDAALEEMIDRCRVLKLRAPGSERQLRMKLTELLKAKAVQTHYSSSSHRQSFAV